MRLYGWVVVAVSAIVFLGAVSSPPSLLDDVDAAYAQVARTMLESGDWVTARLNGVPYFDKPPGQVWLIATSYAVFGVHDWSTRLPMALASIVFCWLAMRTARWAFGDLAGLYAGVGLATCCGLFLFTRARIPDVYVGCTSLLVLDCFLRAQDSDERRARNLMRVAGGALGAGLLFKGLVAAVLPLGAIATYCVLGGARARRVPWRRLGLPGGLAVAAIVAVPWHVLAALRNPPLLEFGLDSGPGMYRGFLWRYLVNEHVLRYLGLRHPADYDRVPLIWFWAGHLAWLFPWSGLLAGVRHLGFRSSCTASRTRLLMLCFCGFTLLFFSASTTQEYYTLPMYGPATLLLASVAVSSPKRLDGAVRAAAAVYSAALLAGAGILFAVRGHPAEGDIAAALTSNPEAYTLALGHFSDLTLGAFAYLREPLTLAVAAFAIGAAGGWLLPRRTAVAAVACAAVLTVHAAHRAMATFSPYLSSRELADAYLKSPPGKLVLDHEYYAFSSVVYYANQQVLLLNGRKNNIEYGSNAPRAPDVFLDDEALAALWERDEPVYLATYGADRWRFEGLLGTARVHTVATSGGKVLLTNACCASTGKSGLDRQ